MKFQSLFWAAATPSLISAAIIDLHEPRSITPRDGKARRSPRVRFSPVSSPTITLARRIDFTSGGRTEYCGEVAVTPTPDTSSSAPLASDCEALAAEAASNPGFYSISADEFGGSDRWARIVSHGTCTYAARFIREEDTTSLLMGTNDIRFYTTTHLRLAENGRLGVQANVQCFNGEGMELVTWALIRT